MLAREPRLVAPDTRCGSMLRQQQKFSETDGMENSHDSMAWRGGLHQSHTWLFVPAGRNEHTPPPQANSTVEAEKGVAVGFLIKLPIHELLVQGAQLGHVGLAAHGGAAVLVPVLRPDGHRQIHGGQDAQHTGDDQRCSVAVVNHCSPSQRHVRKGLSCDATGRSFAQQFARSATLPFTHIHHSNCGIVTSAECTELQPTTARYFNDWYSSQVLS